jgi:hypothetical protein
MAIKVTEKFGNIKYCAQKVKGGVDVSITCDVSGLPLDQVDARFGMYCSDPKCKCLAESKASAPVDDALMKDLIGLFLPEIGK